MAVLVGVAFVAGTLVLTDTIRRGFDALFAAANRGTDVVVRVASPFPANAFSNERPAVGADVLARLRGVDGVGGAAGRVQGFALVVGPDGEPVGSGSLPSNGYAWIEPAALNPFHLTSGAAPTGAGDVVLDAATGRDTRLGLGDPVRILLRAGPETFHVSGFARFGSSDRPLGATAALFRADTAQQVLGEPGGYDDLVATAQPGVSQIELRQRVATALGDPSLEVITGAQATAESQHDVADRLRFFTASLLLFAGIAVFVGTFIIHNTFAVAIAQRTRELALLRAVGASRGQLLRAVLGEALVLGALASALGVAAGILLALALQGVLGLVGFRSPTTALTISARSLLLAGGVGVGVTVLSALQPARRASRVAPVAALQAAQIEPPDRSRVRPVVAALLLAGGAGLLASGVLEGTDGLRRLGVGAAAVFFGLIALGPMAAGPAVRAIGGRLLSRWRGVSGSVAVENAARNPRRTAATASALMIGVGLVAFVTIFASSVKAAVATSVDHQVQADFAVTGKGFRAFLSPELPARLAALPEVETATGLQVTRVLLDGTRDGIVGIEPDGFGALIDVDVRQGKLADVSGGGMAIAKAWAADHHKRLGDTVGVTFTNGRVLSMPIVAIYGERNLVGTNLIDARTISANTTETFDIAILLRARTSLTATRTAVASFLRDYPNAEVVDRSELVGNRTEQVDQLVGLVYVLLLLSVVVAFIGIVNTLALAVLERTREIGLLRAIGMSRAQVRSTVRWESMTIAALGTTVGLVIGTVLGAATVRALADQGLDQLVVPYRALVLVVAVGLGLGVAAAALPARRAARLDVLAAIATE